MLFNKVPQCPICRKRLKKFYTGSKKHTHTKGEYSIRTNNGVFYMCFTERCVVLYAPNKKRFIEVTDSKKLYEYSLDAGVLIPLQTI